MPILAQIELAHALYDKHAKELGRPGSKHAFQRRGRRHLPTSRFEESSVCAFPSENGLRQVRPNCSGSPGWHARGWSILTVCRLIRPIFARAGGKRKCLFDDDITNKCEIPRTNSRICASRCRLFGSDSGTICPWNTTNLALSRALRNHYSSPRAVPPPRGQTSKVEHAPDQLRANRRYGISSHPDPCAVSHRS